MARSQDPTDAIRRQAVTFPGVAKGTSCTQSAFKAGKGTFLFIGPGPKGQGFKAMFKLSASMPQAVKLAAEDPKRFEVGSTGWVTVRFTVEEHDGSDDVRLERPLLRRVLIKRHDGEKGERPNAQHFWPRHF